MLEFHALDNTPYHLAVLFLGAYQDIIGDFHNLFGTVHEALITVDDDGKPQIEQVIPGDTIDDVLQYVRYDVKDLLRRFAHQVQAQTRGGSLPKRVAAADARWLPAQPPGIHLSGPGRLRQLEGGEMPAGCHPGRPLSTRTGVAV